MTTYFTFSPPSSLPLFPQTYNTDAQVPDSAGTATAFLAWVKANAGTLGVDQHVANGNCSNQGTNSVNTILDWSMEAGVCHCYCTLYPNPLRPAPPLDSVNESLFPLIFVL